jgi:steroid delta-isomerase-like uncharacterized protein
MKKYLSVIPLVFLLCFVVGCQDKAAMAELEELKAQAAMEEQNKELIRNYLEEMDKQKFEIFKEVYALNAKLYYPSNSSEPMSIEQAIPMAKSFYAGFPDFSHNIEELIAEGNKVILRSIDRGAHQGEFNGIAATGKKIEMGVLVIFYFNEGRIVEAREEFDMLGLMQQLGMEMKAMEAGK